MAPPRSSPPREPQAAVSPTPAAVPAVTAHVPAVVILGTDAFLAARPATPVQLANACLAAGYSAAVPASWGDELVAAACVKRLASRGDEAVIVCSCPRVVERLRRVTSLRNHLLAFVPPPVAAARYLRARAATAGPGATGGGLTITYIGDCPGAADPAIDRYATPASLLRSLQRRGIVPADQPTVMDERVARDGRRFYSLPGGAPAPNWVYAEGRGSGVVEPDSKDYLAEIASLVARKERAVIDLAPRLGCACSGAVPGLPWGEVRQYVSATEPARAVHEVMDHDFDVDVGLFLETWGGSASGGVPTLATPLMAIAALHDPEAKADAIRQGPPSPVPLPVPSAPARRSGRVAAIRPDVTRPNTTSRPGGATLPPLLTAARPTPSRALNAGTWPTSAREPTTSTGPRAGPSARDSANGARPEGSREPATGASLLPVRRPTTGGQSAVRDGANGRSANGQGNGQGYGPGNGQSNGPGNSPGNGRGANGRGVTGEQVATGPISGLGAPAGWNGAERRKWDGVERRRGWVDGRPNGWIDTGAAGLAEMGAHPGEPRTVPLRQPHTFIRVPSSTVDRRRMLGLTVACSAIVASLISVVTVRLYTMSDRPTPTHAATTRPAPALVAPPVVPPLGPPATSPIASPVVPPPVAAHSSAPAPDTGLHPTDGPIVTPTVTAPAPAPAPSSPSAPSAVFHRRRPAIRRPDASDPAQAFQSTPAPPTPAPKPAVSEPVQTPASSAATSTTPSTAPGVGPPQAAPRPDTTSPELQAIRAEIEARHRRIDSLAHLVDSLRTKPAVPPTPVPPAH